MILGGVISSLASAAQLTVAAAADLAPAQQELSDSFQRLTGITLSFVTGASGMLSRQIENGAPFDVFLSANRKFVADLAAAGHIRPASVTVYAEGRLGVWIPGRREAALADLKGLKRVAIANPQHAPYGAAARQALERAGVWEAVKPGLVMGENVRQALQYAESGNVDAVVTSWSLVGPKGGTLVSADWHDPIEQAAGIVATSREPEAARRFLEFLRSKEGQKILERHGLKAVRAGRSK